MKQINIFGCSEKIEEIGDDGVHHLLNLPIPSIGINHFPIKYPNVDYWIFNDGNILDRIREHGAYKGQKIITNKYIFDNLLKNSDFNIECVFEPNNITNHVGNSGWTAIWWAIQEGYTHVNLYGVLDGEYTKLANGEVRYRNCIKNKNPTFQDNKYQKFKNDVESGFNGKIEICRPFLKSLVAPIRLAN